MTEHIQIGDIAPRIRYAADGATVAFTYPFPIFLDADLEVYVDGVLQTLSTDYVVVGAVQSAGGSVTFTTAPAAGASITLVRRLTIKRTSDFQASGEFRAKVINDELDFQTAALQQVEDDQSRSMRLSRFDDPADLELPAEAIRASKVLAFDGNGDVSLSTLTITEIETGASGPMGPVGPMGPAGADGVFAEIASQADAEAGTDSTKGMTPLRTAQAIAALTTATDQAARDLALTAYIKADIQAADPAGVYGDIISDNFVTDSLMVKTGAVYDAADHYYSPRGWQLNDFATSGGAAATRHTYRAVVPGSVIGSGTKVKVRFRSGTGGSTQVSDVYISEQAASGDDWDMDGGTRSQLLFSGSGTSPSASGGGTIESDELTYPIDAAKTYVISFYKAWSSGNSNDAFSALGAGIDTYTWYSTNNAATQDIGSPSETRIDTAYLIDAISVYGVSDAMTLRPAETSLVTANPSDIAMYFRTEDINSVVEGVDRTVRVSIDGGVTWAAAAIVVVGEFGSTDTLIRADADVSAQSGGSFVWELATANAKEQRIKHVASVPGY